MPFPAVKPTAAPATAPTGPNTTRPATVPRAVFTPRPAFAELAARTRLAAAAITAMIALMISLVIRAGLYVAGEFWWAEDDSAAREQNFRRCDCGATPYWRCQSPFARATTSQQAAVKRTCLALT
jgi:hypothetical protein